jgi:hypothetical protein
MGLSSGELCQKDSHASKQQGNGLERRHHKLRHWLLLLIAANFLFLVGGYLITTLNRDQESQVDDCKLKPTLTL